MVDSHDGRSSHELLLDDTRLLHDTRDHPPLRSRRQLLLQVFHLTGITEVRKSGGDLRSMRLQLAPFVSMHVHGFGSPTSASLISLTAAAF